MKDLAAVLVSALILVAALALLAFTLSQCGYQERTVSWGDSWGTHNPDGRSWANCATACCADEIDAGEVTLSDRACDERAEVKTK